MKNILFDLDGTLSDPKEGITKSIAYALRKFSIEVKDRDTLLPFIGPPLMDSFMQFYGFDEKKAALAVQYYREYFAETGIYENIVYQGIDKLLKHLKADGKNCYIATSKPEEFAIRIMQYFDLMNYVEDVCGASMDASRSKKGDVIAYAMQKHGLTPLDTIMVGDRMHDVIGAKENNIECIGVSYGYGSIEELHKAGANAIVNDVEELYTCIKNYGKDCQL